MPVTGLPFVLVSRAVQTQAGRGFSAVPTGQVHTLPASLAVFNGVLVLRHCNYLESISPERPNARVRGGQVWVKIHTVRMGIGPSALSASTERQRWEQAHAVQSKPLFGIATVCLAPPRERKCRGRPPCLPRVTTGGYPYWRGQRPVLKIAIPKGHYVRSMGSTPSLERGRAACACHII